LKEDKKKEQKEASVAPKGMADGIPVWCAFDKIVDVAQLNQHPDNPNNHPAAQIELGARIIKFQGWRACITVSKQSGFITKGNGRLDFAKKLQVREVPVDYQDYATPELEWADILADNRLAELAEIDILKVKEIVDENLVGRIDVEMSGYTVADLEGRIDVPDIEAPDSFESVDDEGDLQFDHTCPKCGFQFDDEDKGGE
jgi:hypothetical protein